jgi:hypothetical protein
MKALYLDESGEHNPSANSADYPIFVLGGIIADKDYTDGLLTDMLDNFKRQWLGQTDIALHTADIAHNRKGFEALGDAGIRKQFYEQLNALMWELRYSVVACVIRKDTAAFRQFSARDLYLVCFETILELFCQEVGDVRDGGMIIAESRSSRRLNLALEREWSNLKANGAGHTPGKVVADRIMALNLRPKRDNIAGLQMADLVVSPIGRHLLAKPESELWPVVANKLCRNNFGQTSGHGLIVLA